MKRIINYIEKGFSSSKSAWDHLKNISYTPHKEEEGIVLQDGELEIKYTKNANKVVKEVMHRFIDTVK
jgi:hypothetical protein